MTIEFTQEQINEFVNDRENQLGSLAWDNYKKIFSERAEVILSTHSDGGAYMAIGVKKAKKYMTGYENDPLFSHWLSGYLGLHFHVGENFDEHPWTQKILTEKLWHPYKRIDILMKILTVITADPTQKELYKQLEELI